MIKKIVFLSLVILLFNLSSLSVYAADYDDAIELEFYNESAEYELEYGNNWFKFYVESENDIYIQIDTNYGYQYTYAQLYSEENVLLDIDYSEFVTRYNLHASGVSPGYYYVVIYNPCSESDGYHTAKLYAENFSPGTGTNEPNNWKNYATTLNVDTSIIISDTLGSVNRSDIDIYKYTASKPYMLSVKMIEYEQYELSIYIGNILVASTDSTLNPIKKLDYGITYKFNVTHGECYFKVYNGYGDYQLKIQKNTYQSMPLFYNVSPVSGQLFSEYDSFLPKIAIMGNNVNTRYFYVRDDWFYTSNTLYPSVNTETYTKIEFPNDNYEFETDEFTNGQNTIQFTVSNSSWNESYQTRVLDLKYDNEPPVCDDVTVEVCDGSIEVRVVNARDTDQISQRPYRYRIYKSTDTLPSYTEWSSSKYYNYGIDESIVFEHGSTYVIDVQIRDRVAEKYSNIDNDLTNHILTVTKTVIFN